MPVGNDNIVKLLPFTHIDEQHWSALPWACHKMSATHPIDEETLLHCLNMTLVDSSNVRVIYEVRIVGRLGWFAWLGSGFDSSSRLCLVFTITICTLTNSSSIALLSGDLVVPAWPRAAACCLLDWCCCCIITAAAATTATITIITILHQKEDVPTWSAGYLIDMLANLH
jgi:hypothetical protein